MERVGPELRRYMHRKIPHWEMGGAVYFLTFNVLSQMAPMTENEKSIVADALRYLDGKRYVLHAYVVMPDHVHCVLEPLQCDEGKWFPLASILGLLRSYSARRINRSRQRKGAFWQKEYIDRIIRDEDEYWQKLRYMQANPVELGLANDENEYPYFWYREVPWR